MQSDHLNLIALSFGLFAVAVVWFYFYKAGKARNSLLGSREEKTLHEIYESFFLETGVSEEKFATLWVELAKMLELPNGRLLPSDRFGVELSPETGYEFNDPVNDVRHVIEKKCRAIGIQSTQIQTVRDYILAFGKR